MSGLNEKFVKPELLAPVGDMERLRAAVLYGADAVYLAGKVFGMRASPANFSMEELAEAVNFCHENEVRVYVTCNTLPRNDELAELPNFLEQCEKIGVDAFIICDVGVLMLAKKHAPNVQIHISTQAGVVNFATAQSFYEMGAARVVLARELPLEEVRGIRENIPADMEIEGFVHGAMCMSVSGRCLLSNYMTGRDANRGECAQPCRWEYYLTEKKRPSERFTIVQEEKGSYIMNSRDMCLIEHIPELINAGITSLKIEGRAKSAYYVACVTAAYRRAIDFFMENPNKELPKDIYDEVEKISHREYSKGFYFNEEPGQTLESGGYIRTYDVVAVCEGRQGEYIKLKQRGRFFKGDTADVLQPNAEPFTLVMDEIFDKDMQKIEVAPHAEMTVYLKTDADIKLGAYLRIKRKIAE